VELHILYQLALPAARARARWPTCGWLRARPRRCGPPLPGPPLLLQQGARCCPCGWPCDVPTASEMPGDATPLQLPMVS